MPEGWKIAIGFAFAALILGTNSQFQEEERSNKNFLDVSYKSGTAPLEPGPSSSEFVEELLYFFKKGDDEIVLEEDEKEIVLVLGISGVGKSTLTLAAGGNKDNPMSVSCNQDTGVCWIEDKNGLISNQTIISKTLLPNRILETDHVPHTAFYDCPGYFDTRNESVEIANAYFMNKVANHGNKIKFLLIALDSDFGTQYRERIPNMFLQVIRFLKNINHFRDAFSLVGNQQSNRDLTDQQIINRYINFLETVKKDIQSLAEWTNEEKESGKVLIEALVRQNGTTTMLGHFPTPSPIQDGAFEDFPNLAAGRQRLVDLVQNKIQYVEPSGHGFGYVLSAKALLKLKESLQEINLRIGDLTILIRNESALALNTLFDQISNGDHSNIETLRQRVTKLTSAKYPNIGSEPNLVKFIGEIRTIVASFTDESQNDNLDQLEKFAEYLDFMLNITNSYTDITPTTWISNLEGISTNVLGHVSLMLAPEILSNTFHAQTQFSTTLFQMIILESSEQLDITSQEDVILAFQTNISEKIKPKLQIITGNPNSKLTSYMTEIDLLFSTELDLDLAEELKKLMKNLPIIEIIELLGWNDWQKGFDWSTPINDIIGYLTNKITVIKFLKLLFSELAKAPVQLSNNRDLHAWRKYNIKTDSSNINEFWTKFSEAQISAVVNGNREIVIPHLTSHESSMATLNTLLDYTLKNEFVCPNPTGDTIVFEQNYIALSFVKECIVGSSNNPSKIILLAQQSIFVDSNLDALDISQDPIKVFFMAPLWSGQGSSNVISLVGSKGAPPNPPKQPGDVSAPGNKGSTGGRGSEFFGVFNTYEGTRATIVTTGGAGGDGQGGGDGRNGAAGAQQKFSSSDDIIPESECAAWSADNGNIQVRIHPNSCNGESGGRCHADDNGIWVTLYGKDGTSPTSGGIGGAGGDGGPGGRSIYVKATSSTPDRDESGAKGAAGQTGLKGTDGTKGDKGPDSKYLIDDKEHGAGKRCKIMQRDELAPPPAINKLPSYNYQTKNQVVARSLKKWSANVAPIDDFKTYISTFLTTAEYTSNSLVHLDLKEFVDAVKSNSYLQ